MKNLFHFLYMFTGFDILCYDTCPLVPQAASPCPSAMGFASGECRAGELAWQASWRSGFVISPLKIGLRGFSQRTNHLEGAKKNFNLKTQIVDARIRQ
jgi:hypothetical protein